MPANIKHALKRLQYTVLLGPSNSGKTEWFVRRFKKRAGAILSVVDAKELCPIGRDPASFFGPLNIVNLRRAADRPLDWSGPLLVDEIHCFTAHEIGALASLLLKRAREHPTSELFVSMLPGSYTQDPLPNTRHVISNATNIITIPAPCKHCHKQTMHSMSLAPQRADGRQIIIGKRLFVAQCRHHGRGPTLGESQLDSAN